MISLILSTILSFGALDNSIEKPLNSVVCVSGGKIVFQADAVELQHSNSVHHQYYRIQIIRGPEDSSGSRMNVPQSMCFIGKEIKRGPVNKEN